MKQSKWDLRIERSDYLAREHPFATQALQFFKGVSGIQAQLYFEVEHFCGKNPSVTPASLRQGGFPIEEMRPRFPEFLTQLEAISPEPLAQSASRVRQQGPEHWRVLLASSWQSAPSPTPLIAESEVALGRMFLQPFAEYLADSHSHRSNGRVPATCPFCLEKPLVGVLRPEGDGGKRSLICSMCAAEWSCGRIVCPACGEQSVEKLAVYTTDQFQHVRIDACDTCHYYMKTVDLTKTGRAIPVVDELATIPLNLWAHDHGYKKLQINLLGL